MTVPRWPGSASPSMIADKPVDVQNRNRRIDGKDNQADHLSSSRRASSSLRRSATSAARSGSSVLAMGLPSCFLIFRPSAVTGKSSGFSGFLEVDMTSSSCGEYDSTPSNEPRRLLFPEGSRPVSSTLRFAAADEWVAAISPAAPGRRGRTQAPPPDQYGE